MRSVGVTDLDLSLSPSLSPSSLLLSRSSDFSPAAALDPNASICLVLRLNCFPPRCLPLIPTATSTNVRIICMISVRARLALELRIRIHLIARARRPRPPRARAREFRACTCACTRKLELRDRRQEKC